MKILLNILIFLTLFAGPVYLSNSELIPSLAGSLILLAAWGFLVFWIVRGIVRFFKKTISVARDKKTPAELDKEIERLKKQMEKSTEEFIDNSKNSEYRDLCLDSLMMMVERNFGDTINLIKEKSDPLVIMVVAHMFIEQLSEDYDINKSSVGSFAYELFKSELSKDDWEMNFGLDVDDNDDYFRTPVFWANVLQGRISDAYKKSNDAAMRSNVCADFCTDLFSKIDDDSAKETFINLSRKKLKESNLYSTSAESTYTSVEF